MSRFSNVHVGFFKDSLGFHLGLHSVFLWGFIVF